MDKVKELIKDIVDLCDKHKSHCPSRLIAGLLIGNGSSILHFCECEEIAERIIQESILMGKEDAAECKRMKKK